MLGAAKIEWSSLDPLPPTARRLRILWGARMLRSTMVFTCRPCEFGVDRFSLPQWSRKLRLLWGAIAHGGHARAHLRARNKRAGVGASRED
jgi:hypothetical protein